MIYIVLLILFPFICFANDIDLDAKELFLEGENKIKAVGEVEAKSGNHLLYADSLDYDSKTEKILSKGNVKYLNSFKKIKLYADELSSNSSFTDSKSKNAIILIDNKFNLYGKEVQKKDDLVTAKKGVYTNCNICAFLPEWKISASKIQYDIENKKVVLNNSVFKLFNIPVFYFPKWYYSFKEEGKQTGFLSPELDTDSILGNQVTLPIFFNLAPNYDFTYSPRFLTKNNIYNEFEFRYLNEKTHLNLEYGVIKENQELLEKLASKNVLGSDENSFKYFVQSDFLANLSDDVSLEADIFFSSSKAFLERYKEDYRITYRNDIVLSRFQKDSYISISSSRFDELNGERRQVKELPKISLEKKIELKKDFSYSYNISLKSQTLEDDSSIVQDSRGKFLYYDSFEKKFQHKVFKTNLAFRNVIRGYANDNNLAKSFETSYVPQISAGIEGKFIKDNGKKVSILTPKLNVTLSDSDLDNVSNYDSSSVDLNYNNIFSTEKVKGFDLLEKGVRANYGILMQKKHKIWYVESFFGQSYYEKEQENIARISGIKKGFSDFIGLTKISNDNFSIFYNYKLLESNLSSYYNQLGMGFNKDFFSISSNYTKYDFEDLGDETKIDNLSLRSGIEFSDALKISAYSNINLLDDEDDEDNGFIKAGGEMEINTRCVSYILRLSKNFVETNNSNNDLSLYLSIRIR